MKKNKMMSILICLCLFLQCALLPAQATEMPATTPASEESTAPLTAEEVPFGQRAIQMGCRTLDGMNPLGGSDKKLDSAQGAFLYEVNSDTVVYSYNPDVKIHPGSLAKLVLVLIVIENCGMKDTVVVTEGIQSYLPLGANTMNPKLKSLEELTVQDLVYGVMLMNANDAAVALAHHVSGTTDRFLELMNNRVKQMGCTNTEFGNISGLYTAQSYSTARDMAKIVKYAIENETFREIFGTISYTVPATELTPERGDEKYEMTTLNYLMDESNLPDFYDTRVNGGFATYHEITGASIAFTVANKKGDMEFIGIILNATRTFAENGWRPVIYGNFNEATDLIEYGFNNYKVNRIIYDGMSLSGFTVNGGESNVVGQATVNIDSVVPINAQMDNLRMSFQVTDGMLKAPVKKGDLIATMSISYLNSIMAEAEVYAMSDVREADNTGVTIYGTASRNDRGDGGFLSALGIICVVILGIVGVYLAYNSYMRSRMQARHRRRRQNRRRAR